MTPIFWRSKKEVDRELAILRKAHKKRMKSKKEMLAFMVRAGLMDKDGNLTKPYRDE